MTWIWIAIGVVAALVILAIISVLAGRRSVARARGRVDGAWAEVTASVRRRGELAGELGEALAAAAPHETAAIEGLAAANRAALDAATPVELSAAEHTFQPALREALHVSNGYPALVQDPRFMAVQSKLHDEDGRIQAARRFYNGGVRELGTATRTFPGRLASGGVEQREFFDAADKAAIAEPPRIQF